MSVSATFTVRCDRLVGPGVLCGAVLTTHTATAAAARRHATELGWVRSGRTDACPTHARAARLDGPDAGSAGGTEQRG